MVEHSPKSLASENKATNAFLLTISWPVFGFDIPLRGYLGARYRGCNSHCRATIKHSDSGKEIELVARGTWRDNHQTNLQIIYDNWSLVARIEYRLIESSHLFFVTMKWGAANTEVKDPLQRVIKSIYFKFWIRSEYSRACFTCCQSTA